MNRLLALAGGGSLVLLTALPAQGAWQVGVQQPIAEVDMATLGARIDVRTTPDGVPAAGTSTYSYAYAVMLGTGSPTLVDVVNTSTVATTVEVRLVTTGALNSGITVESCAVPWRDSVCSTGATTHVSTRGDAPTTWTTPLLAPSARRYQRLRPNANVLTQSTMAVLPQRPAPRDRTTG